MQLGSGPGVGPPPSLADRDSLTGSLSIMPATKERNSDHVGRASARSLLHEIAQSISDSRARKDATGLRIPIADEFFERGRPWAAPLTDEERDAASSLRGDPVSSDRTLYMWAWISPIHRNGHLDGYRLVFSWGHACGTSLLHARATPPDVNFPVVETRTGCFDSGEIRRAVKRARGVCADVR